MAVRTVRPGSDAQSPDPALAYAGVLTAAQRCALVDQARRVYRAEHDAAEALLAQALDPYSTAVAQYAAALSKAVLKLLDSIPE